MHYSKQHLIPQKPPPEPYVPSLMRSGAAKESLKNVNELHSRTSSIASTSSKEYVKDFYQRNKHVKGLTG